MNKFLPLGLADPVFESVELVGFVWNRFICVSSNWGVGGLVCELVGNSEMLSAHFNGKQSRDSVDLPSTCQVAICLPVSLPLPSDHRG